MEREIIEADKQRLARQTHFTTEDLNRIMEILISPDGCPWDREQTHASLRACLLEEAYEAVEGIDLEDSALLCEELGDLLLQVAFHAAIAKEKSEFEYSDIVDGVCRKLVVRHPHVFGDDYVGSAGEMVGKWEQIKVQTKHRDTPYADMNSVAKTLPSAVRAQKIAKRAEKYGLSIPKAREMNEEALGEAMFALCAMAQGEGIDAEEALCRYTNQIILRSKELEQ